MSGITIVARPNGTFRLVGYGGIDPTTGRERRPSLGTYKSRRAAEQARETMAHHPLYGSGLGPYGDPRLRTGDYLTGWVSRRRALGELRERTADRYNELVHLHLAPALGHLPLVRLAPPAVDRLYVTLMEKERLAPATVRQVGRVLHAALEDAMRRGLVTRNPCDATSLPRVPRYAATILTPEQISAYLADARATAGPALYALYVVCLSGGLRLGEALALREENVDLARGIVQIQQTLIRAGKCPAFGPPKSDRGRRAVLLGEEATSAIRAALTWKKTRRLRCGARYRDSGLIFVGRMGRPLNPSNIRNRDHLPRLVRLKLPRVRLHDLRHANATYLNAAGVDYRTIADRLGHASPSFTLATYAHATSIAQQRAAEVGNDLVTRTGVSGR